MIEFENWLEKKSFITIADLQNVYHCSKTTAQRTMREIKSISDRLKVQGKVTVSDYLTWYWRDTPRVNEIRA